MSEEFKSFFKVVGGNEGSKCKYNTRLDTYGCVKPRKLPSEMA